MKNLRKIFGIIAMVAVIGFSMTACVGDDGVENNGNNENNTSITTTDVRQSHIADYQPTSSSAWTGELIIGSGNSYSHYSSNFVKAKVNIDQVITLENIVTELAIYDDTFFAENNLVIIEIVDVSGSITHEIGTINVENNALNITIKRNVPEIGTSDIGYTRFLIPIKKADFNGDSVNVNFNNIQVN